MATERIVLCGGVSLTEAPKAGVGTLALDLWGRNGKANVELKIEDIHAPLGRNIPPVFHDLVEIATYVYVADQATRRGKKDVDTFGGSWRRAFEFHIPVRVPDLWNGAEVKRVLCATLGFLSDDHYEFTFYPASNPPGFQMYLVGGDGWLGQPDQVMLFSAGLDSLAGAIDEAVVQRRRLLLVNHRSTEKHNTRHRELERLLAEKAGQLRPQHMAVRVNKEKRLGVEPTQRSRSFLYVALGATVARMVGLKNVRFYENGVVSLNLPVCAQVVGGRATRTTHPRVLLGFQALLSLVGGEPFTVDNPFRWETKAQIIKRIVDAGCGPLITPSVSCAHTWEATTQFPHCGVCSQCIDRRFGIIAAGAEQFDLAGNYEVDIFTQSRPKDADKIMGAAYLERANEVLGVKDVGQLLTVFPQVADVLRYLEGNRASSAARLLTMLRRHGTEVKAGMVEMMKRYAGELFGHGLASDCLVKTVADSGSSDTVVIAPASEPAPAVTGGNGHGETFVFRKAGDFWDVVYDGSGLFHLDDTFGAKYLDYLLHHPNEAISAYDLEVTVQPEKGEARAKDSIQAKSDPEALKSYLRELDKLRPAREKAKEDGDQAEVERLDKDIEALEAAVSGNGQAGDAGEKARGNVSKAIAAVRRKVEGLGKKDFSQHIEQFVSTGYECIYNQPEGRVWK